MAATEILRTAQGFFVYSWPHGCKKMQIPCVPKTENEVLAQALWLEKHGYHEEADELIDRFLDSQSPKKKR